MTRTDEHDFTGLRLEASESSLRHEVAEVTGVQAAARRQRVAQRGQRPPLQSGSSHGRRRPRPRRGAHRSGLGQATCMRGQQHGQVRAPVAPFLVGNTGDGRWLSS